MTALARVPTDAGVAPLLDFALLDDPHEAHEEAMRRIKAMPDADQQLIRLLDGERALDALLLLAMIVGDPPHTVPEAIEDRVWIAAARIAANLTGRMDANPAPTGEMEKLCAVVDDFTYDHPIPWALPRRRPAEFTAVRDWMKAASAKEAAMDWRAVGRSPCPIRRDAIDRMDAALTSSPADQKP
jgi:hypothetical protein